MNNNWVLGFGFSPIIVEAYVYGLGSNAHRQFVLFPLNIFDF